MHFPVAQMVKRLSTMQETRVDPWVGKILWRRKWQSTPAWKIPWMEEPGGLQSMESRSRTRLSYSTSTSTSFPGGAVVQNALANTGGAGDQGSIPGLGRSPGGGMATHSSILAWKIRGTEKPGGLQSLGSQETDTHTSANKNMTEIFMVK